MESDKLSKDAKASVLCVRQRIKPEINISLVYKLVSRLYGLAIIKYTELNSYNDKNYHIVVEDFTNNPNLTSVHSDGYVFKILNSIDSRKTGFIESQHSFMEHLRNDGLCIPIPIPNIHGELMSSERIYTNEDCHSDGYVEHIVRLFAYIPGKILADVPYTPQLVFEAGQLLARIHKSSEGFHHPFYDTHQMLWDMGQIATLRDLLYAVEYDADRKNAMEVIGEFEKEVIPKFDQLRKGVLHGDPTDQNFLVRESTVDKQNHVCGILDFNDGTRSLYVFDIAIAIAHLMLEYTAVDPNDIGDRVLAGYESVCSIPELEVLIMKTCVKGRICQSLVIGAYTHKLHPENKYVLLHSSNGWDLLRKLHADDSVLLLENWKQQNDQASIKNG